MEGTDIHYQSIDTAQKFIQLFEKFDEARINKPNM